MKAKADFIYNKLNSPYLDKFVIGTSNIVHYSKKRIRERLSMYFESTRIKKLISVIWDLQRSNKISQSDLGDLSSEQLQEYYDDADKFFSYKIMNLILGWIFFGAFVLRVFPTNSAEIISAYMVYTGAVLFVHTGLRLLE